jgi:predicted DNA-binding protein (MmcQ/YjbR family)
MVRQSSVNSDRGMGVVNASIIRDFCLSRKGGYEDFPFGDDVRVFKVMGKVFALMPLNSPLRISLKCDPMRAQLLRDTYAAVTPGYHLNKNHWNTVEINGTIPADEIFDMIEHSYHLVVRGLSRTERERLRTEYNG